MDARRTDFEPIIAADFESADDPRVHAAGRAAHRRAACFADQLVRALINAAGGPFVQRQPTRAECRTAELDFYAEKVRWNGLRWKMVRARLAHLGLTVEQVEAWAKEAA